ncbi:hypothetical protein [Sphingomonas oryzagri]
MTDETDRSDFFREWSSRAAREALETAQSITRERCSHSATVWTRIANAIEGGDETETALLMRNLVFLPARYLVPVR